MKLFNTIVLGVLLIAANNIQAQNKYSLVAFGVTIDGTSNLHSWDEKVETVSGKGIINWSSDKSFTLQSFNIVMQVNSIKSDEGSTMNNKTYKALKSDQFPTITFSLTQPVVPITSNADPYSVVAKGNLTIAGVTKTVDIQLKISMPGKGTMQFEGAQTIKMTDYGVTPPVALFGALVTGGEITIRFKTDFLVTINP